MKSEDYGDRQPPETGQPHTYSAGDVRQGEIILRTRRRRLIFIAGLIGLVVLAALLRFAVVLS